MMSTARRQGAVISGRRDDFRFASSAAHSSPADARIFSLYKNIGREADEYLPVKFQRALEEAHYDQLLKIRRFPAAISLAANAASDNARIVVLKLVNTPSATVALSRPTADAY